MPQRVLTGRVISDRSDKTIAVLVERRFRHRLMKKTVRESKRYQVHDAGNTAQAGDIVRIRECVPVSKTKSWELLEVATVR